MVVARHTLNAVAMSEPSRHAILASPLGLGLSGDGAVRMFFVLSGWVLAASLGRGRDLPGALHFWVRRVFRIHPPYVAAVLISWTAAFFYAPSYAGADHPGLSEWLVRIGAVHLSGERMASFLAFPGHAGTQLPVGWTLYVEMVFSLLLPFLVLAARPLHGLPLVGVTLALLVAWPAAYLPAHAFDFALGVVSFQERAPLARAVASLPVAGGVALVGAAVVLCAAPLIFGLSVPIVGILVTPNDASSGLLMALGGWGLLLAALFRPWPRRVLCARPVVAVGRSSYSLYLVHMPVLLACALALDGRLGWPEGVTLFVVVLALSQTLATAGWRWIERPSIAAGNAVWALTGRPRRRG